MRYHLSNIATNIVGKLCLLRLGLLSGASRSEIFLEIVFFPHYLVPGLYFSRLLN